MYTYIRRGRHVWHLCYFKLKKKSENKKYTPTMLMRAALQSLGRNSHTYTVYAHIVHFGRRVRVV